jgi:hypothetical protein
MAPGLFRERPAVRRFRPFRVPSPDVRQVSGTRVDDPMVAALLRRLPDTNRGCEWREIPRRGTRAWPLTIRMCGPKNLGSG